MLITCPQCESRYEIPDAQLGGEGRMVRCARCRAEWQANAANLAAPDADRIESPVPTFDDTEVLPDLSLDGEMHGGEPMVKAAPRIDAGHPADAGQAVLHADVETVAAREARRAQKPARPRRLPRLSAAAWPNLAVAAGIAVIALGVQFRHALVAQFPGSASLFAMVGLPVNLRGLALEQVSTSAAREAYSPVLVIDGRIRNVAGENVPVPRLRLSIRDDKGVEIYGWTASPSMNSLEGGGVMPFKTRLASPPADGRTLAVRFVRPEDMVMSVK